MQQKENAGTARSSANGAARASAPARSGSGKAKRAATITAGDGNSLTPLEAAVLEMDRDLKECLRQLEEATRRVNTLATITRALVADMALVKLAIREGAE